MLRSHVTQLNNRIANLEKSNEHLTSKANANLNATFNPNPNPNKRLRPNPIQHPKLDYCGRFHTVDQCY